MTRTLASGRRRRTASDKPRRHTGPGDRCPTIALSAAAAALMGLRWSALSPADVQMLAYAVRIARRGMDSASTRTLADIAGDRADSAASAWFAALQVPTVEIDKHKRRVFDEIGAVIAVTDCTCDDPDLGRRVLRSTLADTATYLLHTASAYTRLSRSWPETDAVTDVADPLRRSAEALVVLANDLGPRLT